MLHKKIPSQSEWKDIDVENVQVNKLKSIEMVSLPKTWILVTYESLKTVNKLGLESEVCLRLFDLRICFRKMPKGERTVIKKKSRESGD